jgi:predicted transcriptional regulator
MNAMTRDEVDAVLDRVRKWPIDQQAVLARIAELIEAQHRSFDIENEETRRAVAEGLAQAKRGEFATDEEVEAAYGRLGLGVKPMGLTPERSNS